VNSAPDNDPASLPPCEAKGNRAPQKSGSGLRRALGALAICALVLLVYLPILPGSFLIDDQRLVKENNGLLNGEFGPLSIWFRTDFTLSTFTFWLEWLAWGLHPGWYHAVNMMLHALSAVLVWRLLARLKIPGAWLAGAFFAIHPVCVNSVARIAELKNTLSLPFFLASFWAFLEWEETRESPGGRSKWPAPAWYAVSLLAFVLALMSKTTTAMLPVVLLAGAAWRRGSITRRDLLHSGPHFVLALGFGLMSCWFQKHQALAGESLAPESFWQRLAAAGQVFWFYLGKAFLPLHLNLYYPYWKVDAQSPLAWLPLALAGALFVLGWRWRRRWGKHLLFGLGCFAVTLFPALGFFDAQFLTLWRVSDHLQYLPLIAPLSLLAGGLASLPSLRLSRFLSAATLLFFAVLAFEWARVFANEETLLRDTLAKNPAAAPVHNDLGVILAKRQQYADAAREFSAALEHDPDNAAAHSNLAQALALQGRFQEAEAQFTTALKLKPSDVESRKKYADYLLRQRREREAVAQLAAAMRMKPDLETRMKLAGLLYQRGEVGAAVEQLRRAVRLKPADPLVYNNLAWLLATCSDDKVRNGAEAVSSAEEACRLTGYKQASLLSTLAAAYAEAGRFPEAIRTAETAVQMQDAAGDARFAALNRQLLTLYYYSVKYCLAFLIRSAILRGYGLERSTVGAWRKAASPIS
jgi:Flp pilus assembly protein TadD